VTDVRKGQSITGYRAAAGSVVADVSLEQCEIFGCGVDVAVDPALRPQFRNITLINNIAGPVGIDGAAFSDVIIDGVRTLGNLIRVNGCIFRRVALKGFVESLIINRHVSGMLPADLRTTYESANNAFWRDMAEGNDWALDISQISGRVSVRGIPASVIRRDPETQVIMTFEQAFAGEWREVVHPENAAILGSIKLLLDKGWGDVVLIADRNSADFRRNVAVLRELQRIGAALPE
jgi:hypothetical protein